jgi:hypothetical protein
MMDFRFNYRLIIDGRTVDQFENECIAVIEDDSDGGWYVDALMVDHFIVPSRHPFHDCLMQFALVHRPRIEALWTERQRQRVLEPEERA